MFGILQLPRIHAGPIWDRQETEHFAWDRLTVCENVTNAEMSDGHNYTRSKMLWDFAHARMCVVIVMREVHYWNKPCTTHIHLTVRSVGRDVDVGLPLFVWCIVIWQIQAGVFTQI